MNQVYMIVFTLALLCLLTAQTAYGIGVNVLNKGTLATNNAPPGNNLTDPKVNLKINATANKLSYRYGYKHFARFDTADYQANAPVSDCNATGNSYMQKEGVTNSTACMNGWAHAWKDWCTANTQKCVQDFLVGKFPDFISAARHQYVAGSDAYDGKSRCPISHRSAAFCAGFDDQWVSESDWECVNGQPGHLVGCQRDF